MRTHVFVATTQGPVAVQRITREDSDVSSVVCIDGGSRRAGVADRYYDFVAKGTGLIARETGHDAWRVDVASDIESGDSWQLAFFLAHVLHEDGRLGDGQPAPGDRAILATGRVMFDRSVASIDALRRKLALSTDWVAAQTAADVQISAMAPSVDVRALAADWRTELGLATSSLPLIGVEQVDEAVAAVSATPAPPAPGTAIPRSPPKLLKTLAALAAVAAIGLAAVGVGSRPPPQPVPTPPSDADTSAPVAPQTQATLRLRRAATVEECERSQAEPVALTDESGYAQFAPVSLANACALTLEVPATLGSFVLAVDLERAVQIDISENPSGWALRLPTNRARERSIAYVIAPQEMTATQQAGWRRRLEIDRGFELRTRGELERILEAIEWPATVIRQTLLPAQ